MYETLITHYGSPLYFGAQMAADAGISEEKFLSAWRASEEDRTVGRLTLEQTLERIFAENHRSFGEVLDRIVRKRVAVKKDCFQRLHPEILPLLTDLKRRGMKIGLISNCFSEEAQVIRESLLFPFFDTCCLSFELGIAKPDPEIFGKCVRELQVEAENCLYVGDGGSRELETARQLGMGTAQAVWYIRKQPQPTEIKEEFQQLEHPLEVLEML